MVPCRLNRNSCTADGRDAADDVAGGTAIHECPTAQRNIVYSHADYGALLGDAASQRMSELNREIVLHPGSRRLAGVRPQWRNVDPNIGGRKAGLRKRALSRNRRDDCKAPRNKPIGNRGAQFRLPRSTASPSARKHSTAPHLPSSFYSVTYPICIQSMNFGSHTLRVDFLPL